MSSIKVNLNKSMGVIKPFHGIGNGPVCFGGAIDSTPLYKIAGFPFIRLHDTNWPSPREIDIPQIFKDFSADENDPGNYDFRRTDEYLEQCFATGAQIIYRLGVSIEHAKVKEFTHPPADFDKWATICLNIIRHCNEGWANGHHWNIRYWEIWNEPDNKYFVEDRSKDPMWSGTPEQYYDLYAVAATKLKKAYPSLMIGGYGSSRLSPKYLPYFRAFLERVKRDHLPLDFFSWHRYADDPEEVYREANIAQEGLDSIGYSHTVSICDEWNYVPSAPPREPKPLASIDSIAAIWNGGFSCACSHAGTSFITAVMARLHDTTCAITTLYEGSPISIYGTIFDRYGYPEKAFYSFVMYHELYKLGRRVSVEQADDGLYTLAAADKDSLCLLISAFRGAGKYEIFVNGLEDGARYSLQKYLTDETHCHELVEDISGVIGQDGIGVSLGDKATMLLKWNKI